jgi:hypothetical protein
MADLGPRRRTTVEKGLRALSISRFSPVVPVNDQNLAAHHRLGADVMRYMLLIYTIEGDREAASPQESQRAMEGHLEIIDEAAKRGILVGVNPLATSATATTVRMENGKVLTTDGPFAETREQLAGYYVLDCKDLDEAIGWAAKIPYCKSRRGCVEIRPIEELPAVPDSFRKSNAALASIFKT